MPCGQIVSVCSIVRTGFDKNVDSTKLAGSYQQAIYPCIYCIIFIVPSFDGKSFDKIVEKLHHLMDRDKNIFLYILITYLFFVICI